MSHQNPLVDAFLEPNLPHHTKIGGEPEQIPVRQFVSIWGLGNILDKVTFAARKTYD
jgi:hypothetical protein